MTKEILIHNHYTSQDFESLIRYIESVLPLALPKKSALKDDEKKEIIIAFEKIDKFILDKKMNGILSFLPEHMKNNALYKRFERFFKLYCTVIRKELSPKSKPVQDLLFELNAVHFRNSSRILNPKYYQYYHINVPFEYDNAVDAYNHVLDNYDCNKNSNSWSGFWSLVSTNNGTIEKLSLFDSYDVDLFWSHFNKKQQDEK